MRTRRPFLLSTPLAYSLSFASVVRRPPFDMAQARIFLAVSVRFRILKAWPPLAGRAVTRRLWTAARLKPTYRQGRGSLRCMRFRQLFARANTCLDSCTPNRPRRDTRTTGIGRPQKPHFGGETNGAALGSASASVQASAGSRRPGWDSGGCRAHVLVSDAMVAVPRGPAGGVNGRTGHDVDLKVTHEPPGTSPSGCQTEDSDEPLGRRPVCGHTASWVAPLRGAHREQALPEHGVELIC